MSLLEWNLVLQYKINEGTSNRQPVCLVIMRIMLIVIETIKVSGGTNKRTLMNPIRTRPKHTNTFCNGFNDKQLNNEALIND